MGFFLDRHAIPWEFELCQTRFMCDHQRNEEVDELEMDAKRSGNGLDPKINGIRGKYIHVKRVLKDYSISIQTLVLIHIIFPIK